MVFIAGRYNIDDFMGQWVRVFLNQGGAFNFKCVSKVDNCITGVDEDGTELTIDLDDIGFIVDPDWEAQEDGKADKTGS